MNERKLLELKTEMVVLHDLQNGALIPTDEKLDTEVAGFKTMHESHKLNDNKY